MICNQYQTKPQPHSQILRTDAIIKTHIFSLMLVHTIVAMRAKGKTHRSAVSEGRGTGLNDDTQYEHRIGDRSVKVIS